MKTRLVFLFALVPVAVFGAASAVTVNINSAKQGTFNTAGVTSYVIGQPVTFTGGTTFNPLPIQASVTTIALLRSYTVATGVVNGACIQVTGYYAPNDGGGGVYVWNSTSTATDNGGTIIQSTGVATGRWYLQYSGSLNIKWFGAKGDSVANDYTAINAALTIAKANPGMQIYVPFGTYAFGTKLDFSGVTHLTISGDELERTSLIYTGSGRAGYEFTGASYVTFTKIGLFGNNSASPPSALVILGRNGSLVGTDIRFFNCTISGYATSALVYAIASDGFLANETFFRKQSCTAPYTLYCSQTDDLSLGGLTTSTSLWQQITECAVIDAGTVKGDSVHVRPGPSTTIGIRDTYVFAGVSNGFGFSSLAAGSPIAVVLVDNNLIEHANGATGDAMHVYSTGGGNGFVSKLVITNNRDSNPPSTYFMYADDNTNVGLQMNGNQGAGSLSFYTVSGSDIQDDQTGTTFKFRNHVDQSRVLNSYVNRSISAVFTDASKDSLLIDNGKLIGLGKQASMRSFVGGVESLGTAGACNVLDLTTQITASGSNAFTLAAGSLGQLKAIVHTGGAATNVLTPASRVGYSNITFTATGQSVLLQYVTGGWQIISNNGATVAP